MFIETLDEENLSYFLKEKLKARLGFFQKKNDCIYFELDSKNYKTSEKAPPAFIVTDFDIKPQNELAIAMEEKVHVKKAYKTYMANKFGTKYKKAFNQNLKNILEQEMFEITKEFDDKSKD